MAHNPHSGERFRSLDSDLTRGEWLGTSCPFCATIIARAQPHLLRESHQGRGENCLNCGRTALVRWGKIVIRHNPDGTWGAYFEPRQPDMMPPGNEEITKKVHIDDVEGGPESTK